MSKKKLSHLMTWDDERSGNDDIYAQRVDANGAVLWTVDGVPICTLVDAQRYPELVSDGAGGAIITWQDERNGNDDIYVQRVDANGAVLWTTDGVPICTAASNQGSPMLVSDEVGGAIITWRDQRSGDFDIYAQRINSNGAVLWTTNGVAICTAPNSQWPSSLVKDDAGGAIITWGDERSGNDDIYAQRVDSSGAVLWATDGVPICTAASNQYSPRLVSDEVGGAIIVWEDYRNAGWPERDIYAQNVNADGTLGQKVGFALSLHKGINIISIPLKIDNYRLSDMAKHIGIEDVKMIVSYDYEEKKFRSYVPGTTPEDAPLNVPVQCGEGYIVIMKTEKKVPFEGHSCTYEVKAAPSPIPLVLNDHQRTSIFVVTGFVMSEETGRGLDDVAIKIRNLRTGQTLQDVTGTWAGTGRYVVTFAASEEEFMTRAGDKLEITAQDANHRLTITPVIHTLTTDEISDWVLVVPLRLSLPKQSVLLQNYPNPFNPETWVPY